MDRIEAPQLAAGVAAYLSLVAVLTLAVGCQTSAIALHARAATVTAGTLAAAGTVVDGARRQALDRVEAQYPDDPEHDEQLIAEDARWRPVGAALDLARTAQLSWVAALEAARMADAGSDLLPMLLPIAARAVMLYADVMRLAASLGTELPELPAMVMGLASSLGGSP